MPAPGIAEPAPPQRVDVRECRENLTGYLRQVRDGRSPPITAHGRVLAEVRAPAPADRPLRKPGALRGKVWMAPDFDDLPPDVLAAMEDDG